MMHHPVQTLMEKEGPEPRRFRPPCPGNAPHTRRVNLARRQQIPGFLSLESRQRIAVGHTRIGSSGGDFAAEYYAVRL